MADILDYFDQINIDVAKRKYYNVNKVNAVLEDLRNQAVELVEENERQRRELEQVQNELAQLRANGQQSQETLTAMQQLYRDTLTKAHERADGIVREADERSSAMIQDAEQKSELAAKQMEECIHAIRLREEQNIEFLEARLQQFLGALNRETDKKEEAIPAVNSVPASSYQPDLPDELPEPLPIEEDTDEYPGSHLRELEQKIQRLAEEITALESGI